MVFILVDSADPTSDFVVRSRVWRSIVAEVQTAGILPDDVAQLICHNLGAPLSPDETCRVAEHLGAKQESGNLRRILSEDELNQLIAFLKQSGGIEIF